MKVRIRKASPDIELPVYGTKDAAGFDIAAYEDKIIEPRALAKIRTGLYFESPPGYFLALFPRSSTPGKKGLMFPHSVGILDPDYSGPDDEALLLVYNFTDKQVEVKKGDRIAQGIFMPVQQVEWEESDQLSETTRGGFGSTGN